MIQVNTEELIRKIKGLPPLNLVVQKLLQVVNNDNASATEVSEILSSDQAIASKVLALVNSSFYGFPSKITTISRAEVILGNKSIHNLALSFAAIDSFKNYKGAISIKLFWSHALAVATSAQLISKHNHYKVPEELFIAGLLHDIGHLILSWFYPKEYEELVSTPPSDFLEEEERLLGICHQDVGAMLLKYWQLPPVLVNAVGKHHSYEDVSTNQTISTLVIADYVSTLIGRSCLELCNEEAVIHALETLEMTSDDLCSIIEESYHKTLASEESFDIESSHISFNREGNHEKVIVVLSKRHIRREALTAAIRSMGYKVHAISPKLVQQASRLKVDGIIFDPTDLKPSVIQQVCRYIESEAISSVVIESGNDILLSTPAQIVKYPFCLSIIDSLLEEE